jgi:mRNA interferase MazF
MTLTTAPVELATGDVVWASLEPVRGREQGGHRPVLVVASNGFLSAVTTLAMVLPITSKDRGWPNYVRMTGPTLLPVPSWAMTEQVRTISRDRMSGRAGHVDEAWLVVIRQYLRDFFGL